MNAAQVAAQAKVLRLAAEGASMDEFNAAADAFYALSGPVVGDGAPGECMCFQDGLSNCGCR